MDIDKYINSFVRVKISPTEELKDYYINSYGDIIGVKRKGMQLLKPKLSNTGYLIVGLRSEQGNRKYYFVHRLVAFTFLKNPRGHLTQVNHLDGNKTNNDVHNLEWTDARGNTLHAYKNDLIKNVLQPGNLYKNGIKIATTRSKKEAWAIVQQETGYSVDHIRKYIDNPNSKSEVLQQYSYVCL